MRRFLVAALAVIASAFVAPAAQAVVVDMNALGHASVSFNSSDQSGYFGVALVPGTCGDLLSTGSCASLVNSGVPAVTSSAPCLDPALPPDLWLSGTAHRLPNSGVCSHGGSVLHKNETFALTWDSPQPSGSQHNYFSGTRLYVEQFLRDVADASGALSSPYAVTTQYNDGSGNAQNSSRYGGGCIDYGSVGGSQCEFGNATGPGHDYPTTGGCTPAGVSFTGNKTTVPNGTCVTDAQIQSEVSTMVAQTGIVGRTQPGYSPEVVVLTPPGVETCLDAAGSLCSANQSLARPGPPSITTTPTGGGVLSGTYQVELTYITSSGQSLPGPAVSVPISSPTSTIQIATPESSPGVTGWYAYVTAPDGKTFYRQQSSPTAIGVPHILTAPPVVGPAPPAGFCSYHSHVNVGGTDVAYIVQPWTGQTRCDEPDSPEIPDIVTPAELSKDFGIRLVSPLSQSHIASIVDPTLNGWFALDGAGINDNGGCVPLDKGLDSVPVGSGPQSPYLLQREFNNGGAMSLEPYAYGCAPAVTLTPSFVVPSGINQGDEVQFDGSTTASTLLVPNAGYKWDFGDNSTATGPSVVHSYAVGGTYQVTLTVTDRGNNTQTLTQTVQVLGPNGLPVTPPTTQPPSGSGGPTTTKPPAPVFHAFMQLLPQGLKGLLRNGISLRVTSNYPADGIAQVRITRALARRLGIKRGRLPYVVIGEGTLSGRIKPGTVQLRVHLPRNIVKKLRQLRHVTLSVRLSLVAPGGARQGMDAAGRY